MSDAYRKAGVNIDAGNETVERIRSHIARTHRPEVLGELGGFGGLFALPTGYRQPVLVAATDGVGTKLKVAFRLDQHETIGIDCVAMCVNDLVVQGAEPLFFLDYLATGHLEPKQAEAVVQGIAEGCVQAGCALIGGETAEMPGMYAKGEYDVAGFAVGIVEKDEIIDGRTIQPGDRLIGLASNGLHSNGFSLVRKIMDEQNIDLNKRVEGSEQTWAEALLTPTRIYVKSFLALKKEFTLKGAAHITGGGLVENLPRVLPAGCQAVVERGAWKIPAVFQQLQQWGQLSEEDMMRTFNLGIGMALVVPEEQVASIIDAAEALGELAYLIGRIEEGHSSFSWVGGV